MDTSLYNLKIISSGGNRLEIYKVSRYAIRTQGESNNKEGRRGKDTISEVQKEENTKKSRKTNLTNTRNNIIRLIKSNDDMKTFLTLTFQEEVDYKQSKKLLNNLFTKLRKKYLGLKYLWVLEFGTKNNRLHYHLLTNIPLPGQVNFAKTREKKSQEHKDFENKFRSEYWKYGFVDIRDLDQEGNNNIALYVSCYIVKDLLDKQLEGYRIYGYSMKTLNKPTTSKLYDNRGIEEVIRDFEKDYDIKHTNSYEIGYTDYRGEHKGITTYFDLEKKNNS